MEVQGFRCDSDHLLPDSLARVVCAPMMIYVEMLKLVWFIVIENILKEDMSLFNHRITCTFWFFIANPLGTWAMKGMRYDVCLTRPLMGAELRGNFNNGTNSSGSFRWNK